MDDFIVKFNEIITKLGLMIMVFFAPLGMMLIAVGLAILLDTFFGRWKASKIGEKVTSKKTRHGVVSKALTYALVSITVFIMDKVAVNEIVHAYFPYDYVLTKTVVVFLIWLEASSIDESYEQVKGIKLSAKFLDFIYTIKGFIVKIFKQKVK